MSFIDVSSNFDYMVTDIIESEQVRNDLKTKVDTRSSIRSQIIRAIARNYRTKSIGDTEVTEQRL